MKSSPPLALLAALACAQGTALGHGAPPASTSVQARYGAPTQLAAGTTFGTLLSTDEGRTWRWICEEAMAPMARTDPLLVWTQGGNLLAGDFYGLGLSKDQGCSWTELDAFLPTGVSALEQHPTLPGVVHAATSRFDDKTNSRNGIWVSADEGEHFTVTSLSRERTYFSGVKVAPSLPSRLYASAWWFTPLEGWLYRSDDSGATWNEVFRTTVGLAPLTLLAVSPANPDVLFASADELTTYRLLRSENGGAKLDVVLTLEDPIKSVEVSADGQTVYVVQYAALHRSRDGGKTFEKLSAPVQNVCARLVAGQLYACGSPFTEGWALARTADADAGFTPVLQLREVAGPLQCPAGTPVATRCNAFWPALAEQLRTYGADGGASDAAVVDAGGGNDAPAPPRGCGCSGTAPALSAALLGLLARLARRRAPG